MANQNDKKKKNEEVQADNGLKPDSKTLHKTDPQENMEGPISSIVQKKTKKMLKMTKKMLKKMIQQKRKLTKRKKKICNILSFYYNSYLKQ